MKAKVIKTENYAVAILPGGSVIDAGSEQELKLRLACLGNSAETSKRRPRGKNGLKRAVLATVGSSEPGALYYAFFASYLAAGRPLEAYAYVTELVRLGTADFLPGMKISDWDIEQAEIERIRGPAREALRRLTDKIMRHRMYRKFQDLTRSEAYASIFKDGWEGAHRAVTEIFQWDGGRDGKEVLEAALANPALK